MKPIEINRYKQFVVMVNEGSGVLFQPNIDEYSYILTAKHTLYNDSDTMQEPIFNHDIKIIDIDDIVFIEKYEHMDKDIAILKIEKINRETPKYLDEVLKSEYDFLGFPEYKRKLYDDLNNILENFQLSVNKTDNDIIVFKDKDYSGQDIISGCSGGGIFKEIDGEVHIVAIEFEMNAPKDSKARDKRIRAVAIKTFDEIVKQYTDELVYLNSNISQNSEAKIDDSEPHIIRKEGYIEPRTVYIEELGIHVAVCPVTFEEYDLFCEDSGKERENFPKSYCYGLPREDYPVVNVSWNDSMEYCKWLTEKSKKFQYSLLLSKDWDYISKLNYERIDSLEKYVWHREDRIQTIQRIATKKAGNLGVFDMFGNVSEWCKNRDIRGNTFNHNLADIFNSKDRIFLPNHSNNVLGFRIVGYIK